LLLRVAEQVQSVSWSSSITLINVKSYSCSGRNKTTVFFDRSRGDHPPPSAPSGSATGWC